MKTEPRYHLKHCPFCGSHDLRVWKLSATVNVACKKCGCHGPEIDIDWSLDNGEDQATIEAERRWNARNKR